MGVSYDFDGRVVLVTGASGALGSAVVAAFDRAGATVCGADVVAPDDEDALVDPERVDFYETDATDEASVRGTVEDVVDDHGRLDALCNVAGTWRGGDPIDETDVEEFELLLDVNLKSMFLASKHAVPHLREIGGAVVSVSARSSLEGGEGDGPYRASKAGVRLLTETLAAENLGSVRANAIMPSVIDTPANREMMPDADHDEWVDPADIADVVLFLCSEAAGVTSGAAVPVYGEARRRVPAGDGADGTGGKRSRLGRRGTERTGPAGNGAGWVGGGRSGLDRRERERAGPREPRLGCR